MQDKRAQESHQLNQRGIGITFLQSLRMTKGHGKDSRGPWTLTRIAIRV